MFLDKIVLKQALISNFLNYFCIKKFEMLNLSSFDSSCEMKIENLFSSQPLISSKCKTQMQALQSKVAKGNSKKVTS